MSYPAYESYENSGVDWLGAVPTSWQKVSLKRYLSTPITDGPHETPEFPEQGVPFISAEAIRNSKIDFERKRGFISKADDARFSRKYKPKYGDIYVVKSGATTGRVAMVETNKDFNIWSPLAAIRTDANHLHGRYLFHFLGSKCFMTEIELGWSFGTQQNIGMGVIGNLNILLPSLSEQKAIADFLDDKTAEIDALIKKKEKLLKLLAEKRTALITQAVTKGLDPTAPMKKSGIEWLGDVPKKWIVLAIKWLSPVQRGASPRPIDNPIYFDEEGEYAWVRIADVTASDGYLENTTQTLSELGSSLSVKLEEGELFLSIAGSVGKPIITNIRCCIHDGFVYFPKLNMNPKLLYYIFLSGTCFEGLGKLGTQLNLNTDTVGAIKIALPDENEQEELVVFLDKMTSHIDKTTRTTANAILKLKEYRSALITNAVTGKIKVS